MICPLLKFYAWVSTSRVIGYHNLPLFSTAIDRQKPTGRNEKHVKPTIIQTQVFHTVNIHCKSWADTNRPNFLLLTEGHTVSALVLGGITLVGTNQNAFQRAVVLGIAMMGTLMDSTFDALVCMAIHSLFLLLS